MSGRLVWLITGTSAGIGRELAEAALKRGDKVIATARARSFNRLDDLKAKGADALELDVTAPRETLDKVAKAAVAIHGRIDVLVNNAGYVLLGAIEENTAEETFDVFNTNVFGALNVARAFLPYMRERRTGTVVWIGSLAGWMGVANSGIYCATKFTFKAMSDALHQEISPLGLRSTCIDFGFFRTEILTPAKLIFKGSRITDYDPLTKEMDEYMQDDSDKLGDPAKGAEIIVDIVHGTGVAAGKAFPTNLLLGRETYAKAQKVLEETRARLEQWKEVTMSTDLDN